MRSRAGTRTPSNCRLQVSEARCPSFFSTLLTENPGLAVSTRKALMPRLGCSGSVTANTTTHLAMRPEVMNCLLPLST